MVLKEIDNSEYVILCQGVQHGMVKISRNPFHMRNTYLKLCLDTFDLSISQSLFRSIYQIT